MKNELINDLNNYFLTLGTVFSTILALVPTLSIIPIQKASDQWSNIIAYLYRDNKVSKRIFIIIAFSCVICFFLGFPEIHSSFFPECLDISQKDNYVMLLIITLYLLVLNLYLLYLFIQNVVALFDPREACKLLLELARKEINKTNKNALKFAKPYYRHFPTIALIYPIEKQQEFYRFNKKHLENILYLIRGTEEIGIKTRINNELNTTWLSIYTLLEIGFDYIRIRQNNFIPIRPEMILYNPYNINMAESDVSLYLINPICQSVNKILYDIPKSENYISILRNILDDYRELVKCDLLISSEIVQNPTSLVSVPPTLTSLIEFILYITDNYDNKDNILLEDSIFHLHYISIIFELDDKPIISITKKVSMIATYFQILNALYRLDRIDILEVKARHILSIALTLIKDNLENEKLDEFNKSIILYIFNPHNIIMLTDFLNLIYKKGFDSRHDWIIYGLYQKDSINNIKIIASIIKMSLRIIHNEIQLKQTMGFALNNLIASALLSKDKTLIEHLEEAKLSLGREK